jgi:Co/Zn/Cd efflux system component
MVFLESVLIFKLPIGETSCQRSNISQRRRGPSELTLIPELEPVGLGSGRGSHPERLAGLAVVGAIFVSACVAGVEAIQRLVHPQAPSHLAVLALAGAIGYAGNWIAGLARTRAGKRLDSPALIADGAHARADAYVSLAVIGSAIVVAIGFGRCDPIIGLAITLVILWITWQSWRTVRGHEHHHS